MNKESVPGSDGFGAFFFQTYWDIVAQDVIDVTLQFFSAGWILLNFNSSNIVLIPKSKYDFLQKQDIQHSLLILPSKFCIIKCQHVILPLHLCVISARTIMKLCHTIFVNVHMLSRY